MYVRAGDGAYTCEGSEDEGHLLYSRAVALRDRLEAWLVVGESE